MEQENVMLHHIEIYVSDLDRSAQFWTPFMEKLGYETNGGLGASTTLQVYLVPAAAEHLAAGYHRKRVGLNHLAFRGKSREHVDELAAWVKQAGYTVLYEDRYPYATAPDYYALYCEDPGRIKVEVVAPSEP